MQSGNNVSEEHAVSIFRKTKTGPLCSYRMLVPIYESTAQHNNREHKHIKLGDLYFTRTVSGTALSCVLRVSADFRITKALVICKLYCWTKAESINT